MKALVIWHQSNIYMLSSHIQKITIWLLIVYIYWYISHECIVTPSSPPDTIYPTYNTDTTSTASWYSSFFYHPPDTPVRKLHGYGRGPGNGGGNQQPKIDQYWDIYNIW